MPAGELTFERLERDYRGRHFILEEVDAERYDEIVETATTTREDPLTGQDVETIDNNLVVKMLLRESLIEPTWDELKGKKLPQRLRRALELDVRTLHFGDEPQKKASTLKDDSEDDEDDAPNSVA